MRSWDTGNWSSQLCVVCLVSGNRNKVNGSGGRSSDHPPVVKPAVRLLFAAPPPTQVSLNKCQASAGSSSVKAVVSSFWCHMTSFLMRQTPPDLWSRLKLNLTELRSQNHASSFPSTHYISHHSLHTALHIP